MNLQDKRIVLTGASSGIGLELLSLLHDKGAKIMAVDRQKPPHQFPSINYLQEDISTQNGVDNIFRMSQKVMVTLMFLLLMQDSLTIKGLRNQIGM